MELGLLSPRMKACCFLGANGIWGCLFCCVCNFDYCFFYLGFMSSSSAQLMCVHMCEREYPAVKGCTTVTTDIWFCCEIVFIFRQQIFDTEQENQACCLTKQISAESDVVTHQQIISEPHPAVLLKNTVQDQSILLSVSFVSLNKTKSCFIRSASSQRATWWNTAARRMAMV